MSNCERCNLRCTVKLPGKKVPYSETNCPRYKEGAAPIDMVKYMPALARFNVILEAMDKEPIVWRR